VLVTYSIEEEGLIHIYSIGLDGGQQSTGYMGIKGVLGFNS
jgi:hypothetical protein